MQVVWLENAVDMLEESIGYIAGFNPEAARQMRARIADQVRGLADHPNRGRFGRVPGTRELVVTNAPYLVAYRVLENEVQVLAILHGARQWPESFDT